MKRLIYERAVPAGLELVGLRLYYRTSTPRCAECEAEDFRERWFAAVNARGWGVTDGEQNRHMDALALLCSTKPVRISGGNGPPQ